MFVEKFAREAHERAVDLFMIARAARGMNRSANSQRESQREMSGV
jgi:hypothetical protein